MEETNERLTVTVREAAKLIGVSHVSLFNAINRGEFAHIRIGRRILIPRAALEKMLENAGTPVENKA